MKNLDELNLSGKRVFVRADLDVPLNDDGTIAGDTRIRAALGTVNAIINAGGSVVLTGHMGRPKGQRKPELSMKPVKSRLEQLIEKEVVFLDDCVGPSVEQAVASLQPGGIALLENLRFHAEEESNDQGFAKQLAGLADAYVNDAFATSHRGHASTAGVAAFVSEKAAGLNLQKELDYFNQALGSPARPLAAIFGGAKVSTKLAAIKNVAKKADKIFIGGAMANTFFAADGLEVGKSLIEPELIETAQEIRSQLAGSDCELHLPVDVVVASALNETAEASTVSIDSIPSDQMALDIGPKTVEAFQTALADCQTIVWNGPMGAFEVAPFSAGTFAVVDMVVASDALTVVGGGDTDLALHQRNAFDKVSYVSTGGGAFLKLLEGVELPAVAALE